MHCPIVYLLPRFVQYLTDLAVRLHRPHMSKGQKCYFCGSEMRRFQPIAVLLKQHLHTMMQASEATPTSKLMLQNHISLPRSFGYFTTLCQMLGPTGQEEACGQRKLLLVKLRNLYDCQKFWMIISWTLDGV
jgi:hypothetical protein